MAKVGIVGSGLIGKSWAMLFASAGYQVLIYDVDEDQLSRAIESIGTQLDEFEKSGLLRGKLSAKEQLKLIKTSRNLGDVVVNSKHVQECVYEDLSLKQKVFKEICKYCNSDETVLCSSTSCIMPSKLFVGLERVSQCIIAHPCNPPSLCPLTEIVPHPETSQAVRQRTRDLMEEIGQVPVLLNKEIDGFALNRIQYSVINECWRLVQGGYMTTEDVDKVMTAGMGMRYAFIGPFETCHLNAEGTVQYMDKYAEGIKRVSSTFGPTPEYDKDSVAKINQEICQKVPDTREQLEQRRKWRDNGLAELAKLKKQLPE
uniref:lambda-crystallin homolog n=1 Tax=Styela clava TaxID=7725 RepID=UPI0019396028|nr:lambda-crystallin homolog [Styela clava]